MEKRVVTLQFEEIEQVNCPYLTRGEIILSVSAVTGVAVWIFT